MQTLVAALAARPRHYRPIRDGRTFTRHPFDPDAPALSRAMPFMTGYTATETRLALAVDPANFALGMDAVEQRLARFLRIDAQATRHIVDAYRAEDAAASPGDLLAAITSDQISVRNTLRAAALQASTAPVFVYRFDWRTPVRDGLLRSPHTVELPFLFGTAETASGLVGTGPDRQTLTEMMIATWSAFAHRGDPTNDTLPLWPRFDAGERHTMLLDVQPRVERAPGEAARAALAALPVFEYSMPQNFARP
jgi:para-nitrobenzyl esterase